MPSAMKSVSFRSCVRAKLRPLGCDATAWLQSLGLSHLTEIIWEASDGVPPPHSGYGCGEVGGIKQNYRLCEFVACVC